VLDFLETEVLQAHDPPMQALRLRSSILERLSGPLCDAVLDQQHSGPMLDALSYSNLFLILLDDESGWYRFHPLFAHLCGGSSSKESIHLFGHEAEREAAVQERVRLLGGEPQIVGPQLEQVAMGAQRGQRKVGFGPGGEHELEGARGMIDEPGEALAGRAAGQPVEVVQDQRDLTQIVQLVYQARQHHVNGGPRPGHLR